jgi:hypothetical protein
MSDPKRALVLHLSSGGEPLLVAVPGDTVDELTASLPDLIRKREVETIATANGSSITVNFAHVIAAHVDRVPGIGQIYGSPPRER